MPGTLIAKRYAKALFDFSLEMNKVEDVKSDMELLLSVCKSNADFRQLLRSPVIRAEKKQQVMRSLFKDQISEISARYLDIITRKRRENQIEHIAGEYIEAYKEFKHIITVHFASASGINDEIRKKVTGLLEEQTKGTIELIEEVKEELVGGFVMKYDDYKYDASIAYQLRKLRKSTAEINLYIRGL
ncbi:MAG: ATP synthase F1 subunit delta [Bacteroidales bacterium]|jgi:F-type H+-transporting ATPase subunit delta|nr:ATP synthase F1 subunit delta [Bacteroidales bacterium]